MENFRKDLLRRELLPIKILMFLIYGGQATLYPYFTVHLRSLNVGIRQTAIIFAVQPIVALLVAPAVGIVADKIGNFKLIFFFFLTFSAITANLLLLVPPVLLPEKLLSFNLNCDLNGKINIRLDKSISCELNRNINHTDLVVTVDCEQSCNFQHKSLLPLILKENENDCSRKCNNCADEKCIFVNESAVLELLLNVPDVYKSDRNLVEEGSYTIKYQNATYRSLECCHLNCDFNCTIVSQKPVTDCLDVPAPETFGVTFWTYLGIRLIVTLGIGLVNGLFDAASMTIIQDLKADVGFQRFWSTVAMCLLAPVSGYFVDTVGDFRPCFFMYGILYLIAAATSLKLDLSMKLPSDNPVKNLAKLLKNPEVILLLIQIAVLGIFWGFLENFLFLFLDSELGSSNLIMGLTITVGSGTGLFMALIATWCTRKIGYVNVIIVAFAAYTARFFGYSLAKDAYTCLIFEMMENFTVTLLTVGVTLYCTELASLEMLTTIMTLWNGLHIISGRAFGSLLGGFLVRKDGFRQTFRTFAYLSIAFGSFYALIYVLWLRKWRKYHKKEADENKRRNSSISDGKEDETMKNEAFTSLTMHCSIDSPALFRYIHDSPDFEFRRRAMSHIPVRPSNSFRQGLRIPRHAASFSGARTSLSVIQMNPENLKVADLNCLPTSVEELAETNEASTKF